MQKSESIAALGAALAKAQGAIKGASKDSENPFFHSKYADLSAVWDACREPLSLNGLSVVQMPLTRIADNDQIEVAVTTILIHSSGEWISEELGAIPNKPDPQGIGSCITYLRRYALSAVAGVAPEDDDGNAASAPSQSAPAQKRTAPPKKTAPAGNDAEIESLFAAIKQAGNVLNKLGDSIEWNLKTANDFANENFNTKGGVQVLTVPQLTEMSKLLAARIDGLKTPKTPAVGELMKKVLSNFKDQQELDDFLEFHKYPKADLLTDDMMIAILKEVEIPF